MTEDPNLDSRLRLQELCARLTDDQLARKTADGWTVSATLAHLAFWDLITLERWKLLATKLEPVSLIWDLVNDAGAPGWHAIPGRDAVRLALEAAAAIDKHIAELPADLADSARSIVSERMYERFHHRNEHIVAIAAAIEA